MKTKQIFLGIAMLFLMVTIGCDTSETIAELENTVQEELEHPRIANETDVQYLKSENTAFSVQIVKYPPTNCYDYNAGYHFKVSGMTSTSVLTLKVAGVVQTSKQMSNGSIIYSQFDKAPLSFYNFELYDANGQYYLNGPLTPTGYSSYHCCEFVITNVLNILNCGETGAISFRVETSDNVSAGTPVTYTLDGASTQSGVVGQPLEYTGLNSGEYTISASYGSCNKSLQVSVNNYIPGGICGCVSNSQRAGEFNMLQTFSKLINHGASSEFSDLQKTIINNIQELSEMIEGDDPKFGALRQSFNNVQNQLLELFIHNNSDKEIHITPEMEKDILSFIDVLAKSSDSPGIQQLAKQSHQLVDGIAGESIKALIK